MPDDLLIAVAPVSQTLSLATLQSYMPPATHWRGVGPNSGLDPDKPSSYVQVFISKSSHLYSDIFHPYNEVNSFMFRWIS